MKYKQNDNKYNEKFDKFKKVLENIHIPDGFNQPHKDLLWEKLEKKSNKQEIIKININFFTFLKSPVLKFGFSIIIILTICITLFFYRYNDKTKLNISYADGTGVIITNNKSADLLKTRKITEKDILKTDNDSSLIINIDKSSIKLYESSEVQILNNRLYNNNSLSRIKLSKGKIYCTVNLPTKESFFEIVTESAVFTVTGTKFYVEINDIGDVSLDVIEGTVKVNNPIQIKEKTGIIKNQLLKEKISNILNNSKPVTQNNMISINKLHFNAFNNELQSAFLDYEKDQNDNLLIEKVTDLETKSINLLNQIDKTSIVANNQTQNRKDENNVSFVIKKINKFSNIPLNENGTGITIFNNEILISCDSNKTVYSINTLSGNINWGFHDKNLKKITSNAFKTNENVLIGTPKIIFTLNNSGKIISTYEIKKGVNYWPDIISNDDKVYIPTSQNIFVNTNNSIKVIENLNDSNGQLYISESNNKLYGFNLNSLDIFSYNLDNKKVENTIGKLQNRAFMAPIVKDEKLYTADIKGIVYKFDLKNNESNPEIITLGKGIISMVETGNYLYFVALDGCFYSIDCTSFKSYTKIAEVDKNPDADKYLTKKLLIANTGIYFSSDTGRIFYYDMKNSNSKFITIKDNSQNNPLIGTPVKTNNNIYFIDNKSNIYVLSNYGIDK